MRPETTIATTLPLEPATSPVIESARADAVVLHGRDGDAAYTRLAALPDGSVAALESRGALAAVAEPARLLAEIRRVLAPGARVRFDEPVSAPAGSRWRKLEVGLLPLRRLGLLPGGRRDLWNDLRRARFGSLTFAIHERPSPLGTPGFRLIGEARADEASASRTSWGVLGGAVVGGLLARPALGFFG